MAFQHIHYSKKFGDLVFKHLIDRHDRNCLVGAARDRITGKVSFFVFFQNLEKIFYRHNKHEQWLELESKEDYRWIKNLIRYASINRRMNSIRQAVAQSVCP